MHHPVIIPHNPQPWAKSAERLSYFLKSGSEESRGEQGPPSTHRNDEKIGNVVKPLWAWWTRDLGSFSHQGFKTRMNIQVGHTVFPQMLPLFNYCNRFLLQLQVKFYRSCIDNTMELLILCQVKRKLFARITCPFWQTGKSSSALGPTHTTPHTTPLNLQVPLILVILHDTSLVATDI